MLVGYARESGEVRNLAAQLERLRAHGCEQIFKDTLGSSRPEQSSLFQARE